MWTSAPFLEAVPADPLEAPMIESIFFTLLFPIESFRHWLAKRRLGQAIEALEQARGALEQRERGIERAIEANLAARSLLLKRLKNR